MSTVSDQDFADFDFQSNAEAHATPTQISGFSFPAKWAVVDYRDFYIEFALIAALILYLTFHFIGKRYNVTRARATMEALKSVFDEEFAEVGVSETSLLASDGDSDFVTYASGRKGINAAYVRMKFQTRQDLIAWILQWVFYSAGINAEMPEDKVQIDVYPAKADNFITAIVHKEGMRRIRDTRFDLSSYTKTSDSSKLGVEFVTMNEYAEIADSVLTNKVLDVVREHKEYVRALIVSDQPALSPKSLPIETKNRVTVIMAVPPTKDIAQVGILTKLAIDIADSLASIKVRPDLAKKLESTRKEVHKKLEKKIKVEEAEEKGEVVEDAGVKARIEREKKERERVGKLSAEEQRKYWDKERERKLRKQQTKVKVR